MKKGRMEAFSDGVLAIIITIMVLELKPPHHSDWQALTELWPKFLSYMLSFLFIGIYWNNHHHMLQAVKRINGKVLWANLALLFFLSLIPFAASWMGENHFERNPVMLYGGILALAGAAYSILFVQLRSIQDNGNILHRAKRELNKSTISTVLLLSGIVAAYFLPWVGLILFFTVVLSWLIPSRTIEKDLANSERVEDEN